MDTQDVAPYGSVTHFKLSLYCFAAALLAATALKGYTDGTYAESRGTGIYYDNEVEIWQGGIHKCASTCDPYYQVAHRRLTTAYGYMGVPG